MSQSHATYFVDNRFKDAIPILFSIGSFGMWQIALKYLNKEQDTFSEIISFFWEGKRNSVQKSVFLLIICTNRNADISNNFTDFPYITLKWQSSAQHPAESRTLQIFQRGDPKLLLWTGPQNSRAVAIPNACHSTSELHSLTSDLFSSTTHTKRGESSFHVVISEMEQKKDKKHP